MAFRLEILLRFPLFLLRVCQADAHVVIERIPRCTLQVGPQRLQKLVRNLGEHELAERVADVRATSCARWSSG